jgi:adenylate cyclase/guanylate cyclase
LQIPVNGFHNAKHARATVVVALAGFLVNALWATVNVFVGHPFVATENALASAGFLVAYRLVRRERYDLAPFVTSVMFLLHMAFVALTFGYGSGAHQFLLLGTVIPYLVFSRPSRLAANSFAIISGLTYFACVVFKDQLPGVVVVGDEASMAIANAMFLLAILATTTAFFVSEMRKSDDALEAEYDRSEALLYNILPEGISVRLKHDPKATIADRLPDVAILFADLVGFTERSSKLPPEEVVKFLNQVFTEFDELAGKHGLEKIKTIGDAYMVAAGVPDPCEDPVHRAADMALDMLATAAEIPDGVQVRIGLHVGPAVAGVIGTRKLFYDVWGETVNMASRMESHGDAGRIQVTQSAREALAQDYVLESRGAVNLKGLGPTETWWLIGRAKAAYGHPCR